MGKQSNAKKSEQLGMPYGTANGRLKKQIMFQLVQQSGRDTCFQCGEKIESADNLSIEHKEPWLDSEDPVCKFYDLDNIAFSHTSCNYGAARQMPKRNHKIGESGYKGVLKNTDPKKPDHPWRSDIQVEGKRHFVGYFTDAKEAAIAFDAKSTELLGDEAITNKSLGLL